MNGLRQDIQLLGDMWHDIRISTATEEMGWPKRLHAQVRMQLVTSWPMRIAPVLCVAMLALSAGLRSVPLLAATLLAAVVVGLWILQSRRRCFADATRLVYRAGVHARLWPCP